MRKSLIQVAGRIGDDVESAGWDRLTRGVLVLSRPAAIPYASPANVTYHGSVVFDPRLGIRCNLLASLLTTCNSLSRSPLSEALLFDQQSSVSP